jgi:hypothetical protein
MTVGPGKRYKKNTRGLEKRAKFCPTAIIFGVYGGRSILDRDTIFLSSPDVFIYILSDKWNFPPGHVLRPYLRF